MISLITINDIIMHINYYKHIKRKFVFRQTVTKQHSFFIVASFFDDISKKYFFEISSMYHFHHFINVNFEIHILITIH